MTSILCTVLHIDVNVTKQLSTYAYKALGQYAFKYSKCMPT